MNLFIGEFSQQGVAEFKLGKIARKLKSSFVRTRSKVKDHKMINNMSKVRTSPYSQLYKSKPNFQRTQLNPSDAILENNMTSGKYHYRRSSFNLFMGELAEFKSRKKKQSRHDQMIQAQLDKNKKREPRKVNNWDKAREIRSGIGTAQRVSQDVRGWLSYAKMLKGG